MRRAAKVDENQSVIVKALRRIGCTVLITSQLKNAFDLLVGYDGKLFIMEVKDGEKPPSQRKLSEGEQKCADDFERVNVPYNVVNSIDEAVELVTKRESN